MSNDVDADTAMETALDWTRYRACCGARWCQECDSEFAEDECEECGTLRAGSHKEELARLTKRCESATPAASESADANYVLACSLLRGNIGAGASETTAKELLRSAIEFGSARAGHLLAKLDPAEAPRLLIQASKRGKKSLILAISQRSPPRPLRPGAHLQRGRKSSASRSLRKRGASRGGRGPGRGARAARCTAHR